MKKGLITFLLIVTCVMFMSPVNAYALELNNVNIVDRSGSNFISNNINIASKLTKCPESKYVLGDVDCDGSVAWLVQLLFNIVKVVGPILVVLLSSIDFIVVIIKSDNEQFQKAQKKLITRLIMALLLFLIVQVILQVFGITGSSTGGIK